LDKALTDEVVCRQDKHLRELQLYWVLYVRETRTDFFLFVPVGADIWSVWPIDAFFTSKLFGPIFIKIHYEQRNALQLNEWEAKRTL